MHTLDVGAVHGRLLLRFGVILLAASLVNGFLVHFLPLQRQALSAHLVGLIGSSFLIGLGAVWPRLNQSLRASKVGTFLAVYGFCGGWLINFLAALTGVFGRFPISVGSSQGNDAADVMVSAGLLTVALAQFALCATVVRGLRGVRNS